MKNVDLVASVYQSVFGRVIYSNSAQAGPNNFYSWLWIVSPFARAWQFALGAILAQMIMLRPATETPKSGLPWTGIAALSLVAFHFANSLIVAPNTRAILGPLADCHYVLSDAAYTIIGGCLIYSTVSFPSSVTSRVLASRPMVMGGDATYAAYLLHPLFFHYLEAYGFALGMPTTLDLTGLARLSHQIIAYIAIIGIGYAVYWIYENPVRRLISRRVNRRAVFFLLALQLIMFAMGVAFCTVDQRQATTAAAF